MADFTDHHEFHDVYPEFNPPTARMISHKTASVDILKAVAALTASTAAAVLVVLTLLVSFTAKLTDLTPYTAQVRLHSSLAYSDVSFPLEYRLYTLTGINSMTAEDGTVLYQNIESDPRTPAEKYVIGKVKETGAVTQAAQVLNFTDLTPGETYLLLIYRDSVAKDLTDALDMELTFTPPVPPEQPSEPSAEPSPPADPTPSPSPVPTAEPTPTPSPSPSPEPTPEPTPEPSPSPTPKPAVKPTPTPEPDLPPSEVEITPEPEVIGGLMAG